MTMDLRSRGRKLSFDILSDYDPSSPLDQSTAFLRSNSDPIPVAGDGSKVNRRNRKKKRNKKKYSTVESPTMNTIAENFTPLSESIDACNASDEARLGLSCHNCVSRSAGGGVVCQEVGLAEESVSAVNQVSTGELRQRSVSAGAGAGAGVIGYSEEQSSSAPFPIAVSISWAGESGKEELPNGRLQTEGSLDWRQLMADDPNHPFLVEMSPFRYFMEEMYSGNSLKSTTALGNEKEREKVYDTIFRLPWRCELLINVGFFVCLNSFLSLFTIMPMRILTTARRLLNSREVKKLSTADLSDFGCLVVLACGVVLLGRIDISLIYHMIRGQGIVKLYVVYNVLEIFDKLWQSISGDILETLFCTADGLADSIERFNIAAFLLFVMAQNILEAEGSWFGNFLSNALLVYLCEMAIDILKHSFMAKFNDIKPIAYSEFLEDLCKQTLNIQTEGGKKKLTFVPLAPASVVIRVLTPVYASLLPCSSVLWSLFWIVCLTLLTYVMLVSLKVLIGMALQKHSAWYILRCQRRKLHSD